MDKSCTDVGSLPTKQLNKIFAYMIHYQQARIASLESTNKSYRWEWNLCKEKLARVVKENQQNKHRRNLLQIRLDGKPHTK